VVIFFSRVKISRRARLIVRRTFDLFLVFDFLVDSNVSFMVRKKHKPSDAYAHDQVRMTQKRVSLRYSPPNPTRLAYPERPPFTSFYATRSLDVRLSVYGVCGARGRPFTTVVIVFDENYIVSRDRAWPRNGNNRVRAHRFDVKTTK